MRVEKLEAEVEAMRNEMDDMRSHRDFAPPISSVPLSNRPTFSNAIETGIISWEQAAQWYQRYTTFIKRLHKMLA